MLVTLLGMVMDVRPLHSENAPSPMLVTLLGMVTEVRLLQPAANQSIGSRFNNGIAIIA